MPVEPVPANGLAAFARGFSLEVTRPSTFEIVSLADIVPRGTHVYLTAIPGQSIRELAASAAALRNAGLEPVAHVAARRLTSADHLREMISALRGEADMRRLLIIGGDVDTSGPFPDALAVICDGNLRAAGIEEIGIAGYPEGHPRIAAERLEISLDEKMAMAAAASLRAYIVTQFSFSPAQIIAWLTHTRARGISAPVRIGMAGPTSFTSLLRYAKRCGVNASLRGLTSGVASGLLTNVGPDRIIAALAAAGGLGDIGPHYFSFGGLLQTARYACDAAAGRLPAGHAMASSNTN